MTDLLQKYISGNASETEKERVTRWILASDENMREYRAQRKLYDIALWHSESEWKKKPQQQKKFSFHTLWIKTAGIAAAVAMVLLGVYDWFEKRQLVEESASQTIFVPAGQRAELTLADGTRVWLNSRSTLSFPGKFTGETRNVKLDGEGYFAVSKNDEQPFIVETDKYNVKVLGTEFNVIAYVADDCWETCLLKGSVEIMTPGMTGEGLRLGANTMARLQGDKLVKSYIQGQDYFQWREGLICFNDISVSDMIEKLELYYGVEIVVKNAAILNNRYTGKFRSKDGIEQVIKVLRLNHDFAYTKDDEKNLITIY